MDKNDLIKLVGEDGELCPYCGMSNDDGETHDYDRCEWTDTGMVGDITCYNCGCEWTEVCTRSDIIILTEGDEAKKRKD